MDDDGAPQSRPAAEAPHVPWWERPLDEATLRMPKAERDREVDMAVQAIQRRCWLSAAVVDPAPGQLHEVLGACIELRKLAHATGYDLRALGRELAQSLLDGAAGWAGFAKGPHSPPSGWHDARGEMRWRMAHMLEHTPSLMPAEDRRYLAEALRRLDVGDGVTPDLLAPQRDGGKGRNPRAGRRLEEEMCFWIAWRAGGGTTIGQAKIEVAQAVGLTLDAVDQWRKGLSRGSLKYQLPSEVEYLAIDELAYLRECSKEEVKIIVEEAEERGKMSQPFSRFWEDVGGDLEVTLDELARAWRAAREPNK